MFCTRCGTKISNNGNFCTKCGKEKSNNNSNINFDNININNISGAISMPRSNGGSILRTNYLEILKTFFIGMAFVTLGAIFAINFLPYSIISAINILFVIFMIASVFIVKQNLFKTKVSMNIYCFIMGIILSVTLLYYIGNLGSEIFISCVLGVGLIFGVSYWYALKYEEEEIFSMGPILFKGMIALLIFEILNIFLFGFGMFDIILSSGAIAIYSAYTLYTMKCMQVRCSNELLDEESIVEISLSLVTSFLNLLLHLLRLIMALKSDD